MRKCYTNGALSVVVISFQSNNYLGPRFAGSPFITTQARVPVQGHQPRSSVLANPSGGSRRDNKRFISSC